MTTERVDSAQLNEFVMKVLADNAGAMTGLMAGLGERLGLFQVLAEGPATPAQLAERAGIGERYADEWCRGMHSAGYLEIDDDDTTYLLSPAQRVVLCDEGNPYFRGAMHQHLTSLYPAFDRVLAAFRSGEGVGQEHYSEHFGEAMARTTRVWVDRFLVPMWLPTLPALHERLQQGATVADVGCDEGLVPIKLAEAFPASRFVGYDLDPRAIERARKRAEAAGVGDRVTFEVRDVLQELPGSFDCITCVDLIHDLPQPRLGLQRIRDALAEGGTLLLGEFDAEEDPRDNVNPIAAVMYGFSVMFCVPTTLAHGGEALGTLGMPQSKVEALCDQAGLGSVERVLTGHPYMALYAIGR